MVHIFKVISGAENEMDMRKNDNELKKDTATGWILAETWLGKMLLFLCNQEKQLFYF